MLAASTSTADGLTLGEIRDNDAIIQLITRCEEFAEKLAGRGFWRGSLNFERWSGTIPISAARAKS
jgi:hypothetical protein